MYEGIIVNYVLIIFKYASSSIPIKLADVQSLITNIK